MQLLCRRLTAAKAPLGTSGGGLAKGKGVVARRGLKETWSKAAA